MYLISFFPIDFPRHGDRLLQVEKTNELSAVANGKAAAVENQAKAVATQASNAAQASEQQLAALEKAKASAAAASAAGEKAKASLRCVANLYHGACVYVGR